MMAQATAERWAEVRRRSGRRTRNRPGGDSRAPIDAPDRSQLPRHHLGAFAVVLVMGGFYVVSKTNHRGSHNGGGPAIDAPVTGDALELLLEAMKEALQLEVERQQSKISKKSTPRPRPRCRRNHASRVARKSS